MTALTQELFPGRSRYTEHEGFGRAALVCLSGWWLHSVWLQKSSQWTLMLHPCVYVLNKHFRVNKPNLDSLLER